MAGKISLGVLTALLIVAVSFAAGWYRRQDSSQEFEIISIVRDLPEGSVSTRGIKPPYTVVGRGFKSEVHILPGILGLKGETVTIHGER